MKFGTPATGGPRRGLPATSGRLDGIEDRPAAELSGARTSGRVPDVARQIADPTGAIQQSRFFGPFGPKRSSASIPPPVR